MTAVNEALKQAAEHLSNISDTARLDVELLMAHALGCSRSDLLLQHMRDEAPPVFAELVERRAGHEPVAYITGEQDFFGRTFAVSPAVLIPRADSETTVAAALEAASGARRVLDCGTGSGALLLTVLADNARRLHLAERAEMRLADWTQAGWAGELGRFDLVIANPPYVENTASLDRSVHDYEPHAALYSGPEGLEDYRALIPQLPELLAQGGVAVFEIGYSQAEAVSAIAHASGFAAELRRDLAGRPRALILRAT